MTTHDLKVHPQYFAALLDGSKPFEARKDDRDPPFAVGDTLRLREWDPATRHCELTLASQNDPTADEWHAAEARAIEAAYTGRTLERRVTYVLRGGPWLREGYVVLGLSRGGDDTLARIAAALGAGADSDLVSLATTLAAFYAAHAVTVERQRDALREIAAWATEAYPVGQFPDQDMQRAASALADAGLSIDALHGQWARHLIGGIGKIARRALEGGE